MNEVHFVADEFNPYMLSDSVARIVRTTLA